MHIVQTGIPHAVHFLESRTMVAVRCTPFAWPTPPVISPPCAPNFQGLDLDSVLPALRGAPVLPNPQRLAPCTMVLRVSAHAVLHTAPVAAGFLLGAGVLVSWGWGTRGAILQTLRSAAALRGLQAQRTALLPALQAPHTAHAAAALLAINQRARRNQRTTLVFAGGVAGTATTLIGTGVLLFPGLFGSLGAGVAAASVGILSAGVPLLALSAAGMAALSAVHMGRAVRDRHLPAQLMARADTGHEAAVAALLGARLHSERLYQGLTTAAFVGVAVGAPLTFFGGPYGLAVLVPGIVAAFTMDYLRRRRLGYVPQLSAAAKLTLDSESALVNEVARTHATYALLKHLKSQRRPVYPYGATTPLGPLWRGFNALHNRWDPQRLQEAPGAAQQVLAFAQQHHAQEASYLAVRTQLAQSVGWEALQDCAAAQADHAQAVVPTGQGSAAQQFSDLSDWLAAQELVAQFAEGLAADEHWQSAWAGSAAPLPEDCLGLLQQCDCAVQEALLAQAYAHAERLLFTSAKTAAQFRERELLDMLRDFLRIEL